MQESVTYAARVLAIFETRVFRPTKPRNQIPVATQIIFRFGYGSASALNSYTLLRYTLPQYARVELHRLDLWLKPLTPFETLMYAPLRWSHQDLRTIDLLTEVDPTLDCRHDVQCSPVSVIPRSSAASSA
jgi:hypothetical protein